MISATTIQQANPLLWTQFDKVPQMPGTGMAEETNRQDNITVKNPALLTDEEAQQVLAAGQQGIQEKPGEALSLHQGLDYSRVMALLADV